MALDTSALVTYLQSIPEVQQLEAFVTSKGGLAVIGGGVGALLVYSSTSLKNLWSSVKTKTSAAYTAAKTASSSAASDVEKKL